MIFKELSRYYNKYISTEVPLTTVPIHKAPTRY